MVNEGSEKDREKMVRDLGLFSVIISELLGFIGVGLGVGYFAWKKWGFPAWVLVITGAGGLVLAFFQISRIVKKDWSKD